ncbi:nucleotidyltransferase domain-containing protein [Candidatus Pacearchaeota archaeon]|nr:nucleotidyltransferase domain-containing protein [Candidatus Pacearchaeota archaeon]
MVNIYKQKLTKLQQEILRVLFVYTGTPLNARKISQLLEVSHPAISKALPLMKKEGLMKMEKDKDSGRLSIELNSDSHKVMQLKRVDNLKLIYESGLGDFLEKEFAGAVIILFGSYSRGEDTIKSDIDIAVIGRKDKPFDVEKFELILKREININFYDSFDGIHKNLKENLFNGIVLYGGVKL